MIGWTPLIMKGFAANHVRGHLRKEARSERTERLGVFAILEPIPLQGNGNPRQIEGSLRRRTFRENSRDARVAKLCENRVRI